MHLSNACSECEKTRGQTPVPTSVERVIYFMAEGILTASIVNSNENSSLFQTTARQLSGSKNNRSDGTNTTDKFETSFDYTPSFIIVFMTSGYTSAGANTWTDSTDLTRHHILASGGSVTIISGSGTNGSVSASLAFSGNKVTVTLSTSCRNGYGVTGSFGVCIYGAI